MSKKKKYKQINNKLMNNNKFFLYYKIKQLIFKYYLKIFQKKNIQNIKFNSKIKVSFNFLKNK